MIFDGLDRGHYGVILCDPPWSFATWSKKNQTKAAPYAVMSMADLAALPVRDLAAPDCAMVMWAVQAMVPEAIDLMRTWGFKVKSFGAWAKQSSTGEKWAFGTGYIFRCAAEFYLLGTIGKPKTHARNVRNLIVAPNREHSRKPSEMHENLERMFPNIPKAELFARQSRDGWATWGNQSNKFDEAAA